MEVETTSAGVGGVVAAMEDMVGGTVVEDMEEDTHMEDMEDMVEVEDVVMGAVV